MTFKLLEVVVLTRDLPDHGLESGDLGTIVYVHEADAYEVEFVLRSGATQALVTLTADELRPLDGDDLMAARRVPRSA